MFLIFHPPPIFLLKVSKTPVRLTTQKKKKKMIHNLTMKKKKKNPERIKKINDIVPADGKHSQPVKHYKVVSNAWLEDHATEMEEAGAEGLMLRFVHLSLI